MLVPDGKLGLHPYTHVMAVWERCRLPDNISYEEWVRYVFDHPVLDPQWWWQDPESGHLQHWNEEADSGRTSSRSTARWSTAIVIASMTRCCTCSSGC